MLFLSPQSCRGTVGQAGSPGPSPATGFFGALVLDKIKGGWQRLQQWQRNALSPNRTCTLNLFLINCFELGLRKGEAPIIRFKSYHGEKNT